MLAKELICHPSSFFSASSEPRTRWWIGPYSPKLRPKEEDAPALHLACLLGIEPWADDIIENHKGLRILFGARTDPLLKQDHERRVALHFAATGGHVVTAKLLLSHRVDVDARDKHGLTALHMATKAGFVEMAELLLTHGSYVDTRDEIGRTALYWAVYADQEAVVKVLLDHEADIRAEDDTRTSALDLAVTRGAERMIDLLLGH